MKISSSVIRSTTRFESLIALLILTVVGSSWLVLRADVPQVASGTWVTGGPFGDLPRDVASTVLPDGRLVVTGGSDSDGQPLAIVAFYEPASGAWSRAAMLEPRAGHTVTALANGQLLITGGRASAGVTATAEVFDPTTGASVPAGALSLPRADHAAARLDDGRVLIVGGANDSGVLASADIFDPASGSIAALPVSLLTPRMKLSATTLLDGHVLIAGGNDGSSDLASTEIFDAYLELFAEGPSLATPRSGHLAMLLPHNNTVLIAGGTSAGATLKSVERFVDWNWTVVSESNSMAVERSGAVGVPTSRDGVALVAGGGSAQAELYGFATLKTDKDDYAPGEIVTFTGSGWQPGETVILTVSEDADSHHDFEFTAVADEFGTIVNTEFYPREDDTYHHMGMRFYAMAKGIASEAQTTFTDGGTLTITFAGQGSGSVSGSGAGHQPGDFTTAGCTSSAITGSCSLVYTSNGNAELTATAAPGSTFKEWGGACSGSGTCTVKMDGHKSVTAKFEISDSRATPVVTWSTPADIVYGTALSATQLNATADVPGSFTYTPVAGALLNAGANQTLSVTFTPTDAATYNDASKTIQINVLKATPTVTVEPVNVTFDGLAHGTTGTVTGVNDAPLGAATISYNTADGQAPVNAGSYVATGNFAGNDNYAAASNTATIEITKKAASVTPTAAGKIYGETDPTLTGTVSDFLAADNVIATYSRTAGETVGAYVISATLAPVAVLGNYDITYNTASFDIAKKAASVTPTAAGKTYGDADPALSGTLEGFLAADNVTATYSRTEGETVGAYVISATFAPVAVLGNYEITYHTAGFDIAKKAASVTPAAAGKTYGDADPVLSGTLSGFLAADNVTATYSRAAGETVGTYAISATLAPAAVLGNYDVTTNPADFTITRKAAAVTLNAASKTYGDADPALSGTLSGFLAADNVTATYSRAAGETVGTYVISAMLAPVAVLGNYDITYNSPSFEITKKAASVTPNAATKIYGGADPVFTGTLDGFLPADNVTATYSRTAGETVAGNPYTISATLSPADVLGNYAITYNTASFKILYRWDGFLQPINDTAHDLGLMSKFKAGQTIPAKFVLKNAAGAVVQQTGIPTFTRTERLGACDSGAAPENPELVSASVVPQYTWDGVQYHHNWSTKELPAGLYRIFANLGDGTARSVDICLTK